jgi:EmrB/QacA subfamily drug resistance transporter
MYPIGSETRRNIQGVSLMKASYKWGVAAVVSVGMAIATLDTTIVAVILPDLQKAFHTDFDTITWVSSAYFLAQAGVIPVIGYLSDRLGSKRVFLTTLGLFTLASLLCALSSTKEELIAFRVLQGIGGGALVPLAYATIFRVFSPRERGKVVGIISVPILLAPALGPTIGGYLSTSFDWNAVFMVNVPIGVVDLLLSFLILPRPASDGSGQSDRKGGLSLQRSSQTNVAKKRFDIVGLLLSILGITALVYGINQAASNGWDNVTVLIPLLIGAAMLIVFTVVEWGGSDPVLDLQLFKNSTFTISNVLIWFTIGVFIGGTFLLPLFFEKVRGYTALVSGSFLISSGLGMAAAMFTSGMLYNRLGPRILTVFGLLLLVGGTYRLTLLDVKTTGQELQIWFFLRSMGLGFAFQPSQTLALSVVSNKSMAKASSLVNTARQVVTATAVAALTTYLTQQTATHSTESGIAAVCGTSLTQGLASAGQACVQQHALAAGIADTYWLMLILSAVCIPLALLIKRSTAVAPQKQTKQAEASREEIQPILASQGQFSVREKQSRGKIPTRVRLVPLRTD